MENKCASAGLCGSTALHMIERYYVLEAFVHSVIVEVLHIYQELN